MLRRSVFACLMLVALGLVAPRAALAQDAAQDAAQGAAPEAATQEAATQEAATQEAAAPASTDAYRDRRAALIAQGWKPDVRYGLKTAAGKPLYRFPELVCGPTLCSAKWRDRAGAEQVISVLRGETEADYRVAPQ